MQRNHSNSEASWARGFAALLTASILAAGGALAGPAEKVLHSFAGAPTDGNQPIGGLIADSAGNLYGTTELGGASACGEGGCGVVFELTPGGTYTVLHSFAGGPGDGAQPIAGLIADSAGNLYGTTGNGGTPGQGVVFKFSPGGTYTVLHSFAGGTGDGAQPLAGLTADSAGNLYGTTNQGGASGQGVVFKLSPGGTETVLYSFTGGSDGAAPNGLVVDSTGNLYGTTQSGASGYGVVFKLSQGGTETVLYSFTGGSDGAYPRRGLIADSSGNLYGTTLHGGTLACGTGGCGVVFKVSAGGTYTMLHSFSGGSDGGEPLAGVIADSGGHLYGTNTLGGPSSEGVVFKLSPGGIYTVLYSFALSAGGNLALGNLIPSY